MKHEKVFPELCDGIEIKKDMCDYNGMMQFSLRKMHSKLGDIQQEKTELLYWKHFTLYIKKDGTI